jgi:hypothetical protein
MSNEDFEPIRRRIMVEAYELADRDVEGYNAIKVMCGDVQKMLPAQWQWVGLTDGEKQTAIWTDGTFGAGVLWADSKLKEKNT